eukprot:TRINITY_DN5619_c0_g1_i7.p1 TRINITY_DN5619_c0_g1~~TRINITY_DN5619_c0_g1_i7.p1  ORF type:complete len:110 (+),score=6.28 TRINITY_DN5619_c0_g1_i7:153-482(+)
MPYPTPTILRHYLHHNDYKYVSNQLKGMQPLSLELAGSIQVTRRIEKEKIGEPCILQKGTSQMRIQNNVVCRDLTNVFNKDNKELQNLVVDKLLTLFLQWLTEIVQTWK